MLTRTMHHQYNFLSLFVFLSIRLELLYLIGGCQTGKFYSIIIVLFLTIKLSSRADCSGQEGFVNDTVRSTCLLGPSQRIGIYTFTTFTAVLLNFARAILFYFICLRASYVLHNRMFSAIMRTFVQFFDNNPAGI